jgi:hypothetical protein
MDEQHVPRPPSVRRLFSCGNIPIKNTTDHSLSSINENEGNAESQLQQHLGRQKFGTNSLPSACNPSLAENQSMERLDGQSRMPLGTFTELSPSLTKKSSVSSIASRNHPFGKSPSSKISNPFHVDKREAKDSDMLPKSPRVPFRANGLGFFCDGRSMVLEKPSRGKLNFQSALNNQSGDATSLENPSPLPFGGNRCASFTFGDRSCRTPNEGPSPHASPAARAAVALFGVSRSNSSVFMSNAVNSPALEHTEKLTLHDIQNLKGPPACLDNIPNSKSSDFGKFLCHGGSNESSDSRYVPYPLRNTPQRNSRRGTMC